MEENKKYRILGTLLYYILKIISSTLKIEIINKYGIDMQKPHIYGFWHSKLFITPIFFKDVEKKTCNVKSNKRWRANFCSS